jgi:hypothetical protein
MSGSQNCGSILVDRILKIDRLVAERFGGDSESPYRLDAGKMMARFIASPKSGHDGLEICSPARDVDGFKGAEQSARCRPGPVQIKAIRKDPPSDLRQESGTQRGYKRLQAVNSGQRHSPMVLKECKLLDVLPGIIEVLGADLARKLALPAEIGSYFGHLSIASGEHGDTPAAPFERS